MGPYEPGLFLRLYHGRIAPDEEMQQWGTDGPTFGPLACAISGSVVVASVAHASWNAVAYTLYGFGKKAGALGIEQTWLFAPEIGLAGLALNAAFLAALFRFRALPAAPLPEPS